MAQQLSHALQGIVGDTDSVHTEARNTIGQVAYDPLTGDKFIYLKGVANTVATDFVTYDEAGVTARLVQGASGPVAVAMAAVVANNWGWYQIGGSASANVGTVADNAQLYASGTAGRADDDPAVGNGNRLEGVITRSTDTSNVATVSLDNPRMGPVVDSDYRTLAASITYDANTTPALITGMAWPVVAGGTYIFDADFATTMTTNAGLTLAFKLTTATLTSIRYNTYATTATDNADAVSTTGTTTTDLTEPFNSKTAAYTRVRMFGSFVVNAGGTFSLYGCQETSGTGGDVTLLLIGSTAMLKRVA